MCKDESEWLSAHCEAPEITVADGRHQVGTVYGHCVWTAAGVVMGTRVVREEHVDGRRDRGNERIEMSRDRQAEFRHPGSLCRASLCSGAISAAPPNQHRNWFGRLEKPLLHIPLCISHPISHSQNNLKSGISHSYPGIN